MLAIASNPRSVERPVQVFVIDPHPVTRRGLSRAISQEPGLALCGSAGDIDASLPEVERLRPDLVVVEPLAVPRRRAPVVLRRLAGAAPGARILVLCARNHLPYVDDLLAAGAAGYVYKGLSIERILHAVREITEGKRVVLLSSPA